MEHAVRSFRDLVQVLENHPEWRAELRRLVLTDELLTLPELVRGLAEAQNRTEGRVEELAEAQARTERRLEELAEAQARTEKRVEELTEAQARLEKRVEELTTALAQLSRRVDELAEALAQLTRRVDELAEAQRRTELQLAQLAETQQRLEWRVARLEDRVGGLLGSDLERRFRERAPAFFGRILRRVRPVDTLEVAAWLDEAVQEGRISEDERLEVLWTDAVVQGVGASGAEVAFVVEASYTVSEHDVERARRRADILARVLDCAVYAAVAGELIPQEVRQQAERQQVWQFEDGRARPPADGPSSRA